MEVVCPFCPLRCPATPLELTDNGLHIADDFCQLAAVRAPLAGQFLHDFHSRQTDWRDLVRAANQLITPADDSRRSLTVVKGTILDIQTARESVRLASRLKGTVDAFARASDRFSRDVREREGWVGATLGELHSRADAVLLIGTVDTQWPRLLRPGSSQQTRSLAQSEKRILRLHRRDEIQPKATVTVATAKVANEAEQREASIGFTSAEHLTRLLNEAAYAIRSGQPESNRLAAWLRNTQYVCVLCTGDDVDLLAVSALNRLIDLLNETSRAVLIPVSEAITFQTVSSWLTGFSGPIDFQQDLPRLMEWSEEPKCDTRIWLQPFPDCPPPPDDAAKLILIGTADDQLISRADVYIRTAMPGIEVQGTTFRGDGTIALPLSQIQDTKLPSASQVLEELAVPW